jgi:hypothetical protein
MTFGLTRRAPIKTPNRDALVISNERIRLNNLAFGSDVRGWLISIEPNVILLRSESILLRSESILLRSESILLRSESRLF